MSQPIKVNDTLDRSINGLQNTSFQTAPDFVITTESDTQSATTGAKSHVINGVSFPDGAITISEPHFNGSNDHYQGQ